MIHRDNCVHFTVLIVLLFIVSFSASASYALVIPGQRNFLLVHRIAPDSRFSFYFLDPTGHAQGAIDSVEISESGAHIFARFAIKYTVTLTFSSIQMTFSPLVNNENDQLFYDYHMNVLVPHTASTILVDVSETPGGHGAGTAQLVTEPGGKEFEKTVQAEWQDADVADLKIILDDTNAMVGTYSGSITVEFTVRDTI